MDNENWFETQALLKVQSLKKNGVMQVNGTILKQMPNKPVTNDQLAKTTSPPEENKQTPKVDALSLLQPNASTKIPQTEPLPLEQKTSGWLQTLKLKMSQLSLTKLLSSKNNKIAIALIALAIALVFVLNLSGTLTSDEDTTSTSFNALQYVSSSAYVENLEEKLTQVLSKIKGVGTVSVMVTLESGPELKIATSVDENKTTSTSSSTTTTNVTVVENPIIITQDGESTPLVLMEIMPVIQGVIVVAQGAGDTKVKLQLLEAIQSLLDVESSNIQIYASI